MDNQIPRDSADTAAQIIRGMAEFAAAALFVLVICALWILT